MVSLLRTISKRPCVGGGGGWACGVSAAKQIVIKEMKRVDSRDVNKLWCPKVETGQEIE
jgi:hypothetical protein